MRFKILLLSTLFIAALPLSAQTYRPWSFHAGAGWPAAIGNTQDAANGSFHLMGGAIRNFSDNFGLRLDAEYDRFNANGRVLDSYGARDGYANIWSASADLQYTIGRPDATNWYLFGGVGTHYKQTYLTEPGTGIACDPWWGVCYPVGVDVVTNKKSDTAFGANAGVGLSTPMSSGASFFVEAKYQWVNTPRQGAEFIPITLGLRW